MFVLSPLPYAFTALEPVIDAQTVELHYTKHHQGYVNKLNELIAGTPYEWKSLEEIIKSSDWPVFNNAAQMRNQPPDMKDIRCSCEQMVKLWSFSNSYDCKCHSELLIRTNLARATLWWELGDYEHKQCLKSFNNRQKSFAWYRYLGTCLLSQISESQNRICY